MKKLYELRDMLCEELDRITGEVSKSKMSQAHLDLIHKLTDTIKNIEKICMFEEQGYSQAGHWEASIDGEYGRGESYNRGMSQARGGRGGTRGGNYRRGYSRDDAKDEMFDKLEDLMYEADDGKTKEALKKCVETLKQL